MADGAPVLTLENIWLSYGREAIAVRDLTLSVGQGEFVTLLGPSGSGKTSTLRLIGGFERPDRGTIRIKDADVTRLPPNARDTATIFQSGALFPHKTVAQNIDFGLRMRKLPRTERATRISEMLRIVDLQGYEDRLPATLSGGQRQRVALARSLALRPSVLLFDEPLSALDLSLRLQLRREIKRLHEALGFTAIFVTHDQGEAMSMSDRVAVMNRGELIQIDRPEVIYARPATEFIYNFVGESSSLTVTPDLPLMLATPAAGERLCLRPGQIRLGPTAEALPNRLQVELRGVEFLGDHWRYHLAAFGQSLIADTQESLGIDPGQIITAGWRSEDQRWFSV